MFDKNFYPTPKNIIEKMLEPYKMRDLDNGLSLSDKIILEPSAGKGDILNYIEENTYYSKPKKVYCIEKDVNLQTILKENHHKLIDSDFLNHAPDFDYNLIIMNPPFDNGADHLLKAWNILRNGDIVCLLNEETVKNPCTKTRELLKRIIEENGSIEYLGDCFATAERKTGVNVAMIRLSKTKDEKRFQFNGLDDKEEINFDDKFIENGIATRDTIENICVQYQQIKKDYIEMLKYKNKINDYSRNVTGVSGDSGATFLSDYLIDKNSEEEYLNFISDLKRSIWNNIIRKTNIEKYMTVKAKRDFTSNINTQHDIAITKKNIYELVNIIFMNRFKLLDQGIEEVFNIFTSYHEENRLHIEGWKTNDKWKVTQKVILPYWVKYGDYCNADQLRNYGDHFRVGYQEEYGDIDKALCYISGKDFEKITTVREALDNKFRQLDKVKSGIKFDNTCESTFFDIKFFKKGTIHLTFKDDWLWKEFNMRACAGKNWLPERDMRAWEKSKREYKKSYEAKIQTPLLTA